MSLAGASTISPWSQPFGHWSERNSGSNNFYQLSQALQSGDLAGAQQAYSNLTARSGGNRFANTQVGQDLSALGQALQAGDLAGAQTAFATLQQDFKAAAPAQPATSGASGTANRQNTSTQNDPAQGTFTHHFHHHGGRRADPVASSSGQQVTLNINESDAGGDQVTLNLGNSSGQSPENVTINFSGGSTSNAPEQVTLNLGSGNETITLNFGGSSSAASTPATSSTTSSTTGSTASSGSAPSTSTAARVVNVTG